MCCIIVPASRVIYAFLALYDLCFLNACYKDKNCILENLHSMGTIQLMLCRNAVTPFSITTAIPSITANIAIAIARKIISEKSKTISDDIFLILL